MAGPNPIQPSRFLPGVPFGLSKGPKGLQTNQPTPVQAVLPTLLIAVEDDATTADTATAQVLINVVVEDDSTTSDTTNETLVSFVNISDAANASDSASLDNVLEPQVSDSATTSDSATVVVLIGASVVDNATAADTSNETLVSFVNVSDAATTSDSAQSGVASNVSVSDSSTTTDSTSETLVSLPSVTDAATTGESVQASVSTSVSVEDDATTADSGQSGVAVRAGIGTFVYQALARPYRSTTSTVSFSVHFVPQRKPLFLGLVVAQSRARHITAFAPSSYISRKAAGSKPVPPGIFVRQALQRALVGRTVPLHPRLAPYVPGPYVISVEDDATTSTSVQVSIPGGSPSASVEDDAITSDFATVVVLTSIAVEDDVIASDSANETLVSLVSVEADATAADTTNETLVSNVAVEDDVTTGDTGTAQVVIGATTSDAATAGDSTNETLVSNVSVTDSSNAADSTSEALLTSINVTDSANTGDSVGLTDVLEVQPSDAAVVSDSVLLSAILGIQASDNVTVADIDSVLEPFLTVAAEDDAVTGDSIGINQGSLPPATLSVEDDVIAGDTASVIIFIPAPSVNASTAEIAAVLEALQVAVQPPLPPPPDFLPEPPFRFQAGRVIGMPPGGEHSGTTTLTLKDGTQVIVAHNYAEVANKVGSPIPSPYPNWVAFDQPGTPDPVTVNINEIASFA